MQQFVKLINQRLERINSVQQQKGDLSLQNIKLLKQEERKRCFKENLILAMMKSRNKMLTVEVKKMYIQNSLMIMKKMLPEFNYMYPDQGKDQFLNSMVCLFHRFFIAFQIKWNFKTSIQKLLRPTNFNIIHDLIKYLSNFTRDFYQHIYYWKFKEVQKKYNQQDQFIKQEKFYSTQINSDYLDQKVVQPKFLRNTSNFLRMTERNNKQQFINGLKKNNLFHYDILDILCLPSFAGLEKKKINLENLAYKIRSTFKQCKNRNCLNRQTYNNYMHTKFNSKKTIKLVQLPLHNQCQDHFEQENKVDELDLITYPFKIQLSIDKNGFSQLLVGQVTKSKQKFMQQKIVSKKTIQIENLRRQCLLNNLKVLRVTDKILPKINNCVISEDQKDREKSQQWFRELKTIKTLSLFSSENKERKLYQVKQSNEQKIIKWLGKKKSMKMEDTIKSLTLKRQIK